MADWANPGSTAAPAETGAPAPAANVPGRGGGGGRGRNSFSLAGLSILDICLSAAMATLGVLTILNLGRFTVADVSEVFLAGYMILFAVLLFLYEVMWWSAVPAINKSLRKNFGFLYGLKGKGLYLIFAAFLCVGLARNNNSTIQLLTYGVGIAYMIGGVLHLIVACCQPEISDRYAAPTAGLDGNVV